MSSPSDDAAPLTVGRALALGALHGPAELLPVSSSGHVAVVPWLLGWGWERLDGELRKAFEVALHAGTAGALLIALRSEVAQGVREIDADGLVFAALALAPAAIAGLTLEQSIERRLGTPATVAAGLACGSVAMALADRAPQTRTAGDATPVDALWLGLAQA
ncbi:MAG: undecaprenyl-diphosphate phosphatase, partial [Solirubrobacteraceae bacterium]